MLPFTLMAGDPTEQWGHYGRPVPVEPPPSEWSFAGPVAVRPRRRPGRRSAPTSSRGRCSRRTARALPDADPARAATRWAGSARCAAACCRWTGCDVSRSLRRSARDSRSGSTPRSRRSSTPAVTPPATAGWIDARHPRGVPAPAPARLGALGGGVARRAAGRRAVRRGDRRAVRGGVDVPPASGTPRRWRWWASWTCSGDEHRAGRLLDVQWSTPHLASLGVVEISRAEYLVRLTFALGPAAAGGVRDPGRRGEHRAMGDRGGLRPTTDEEDPP